MANTTGNINNNNNNTNNSSVDTSALNKDGTELDKKFSIQKKMATARSIDNSYRIEEGVRIYNDKEAERRNEILLASARPMKSEAEILKENQLICNELERQRYNFMRNNNKNNNYDASVVAINRSGSVKDLDRSIAFKLAFNNDKNNQSPSSQQQRQQRGTSVNMTQSPNDDTNTESGILVQRILDDLRKNVLSDGAEYDSNQLSDIIKKRYPGVTPEVLKVVIDTIFNDATNMKSRIAGLSYKEMRLLVSARNPNQLIQQQQLQQQQLQQLQPQQNNDITKQPFGGHKHLQNCVDTERKNYPSLNDVAALSLCQKQLMNHLKNQPNQQLQQQQQNQQYHQQQTPQQKSASNSMSNWQELKSRIIIK